MYIDISIQALAIIATVVISLAVIKALWKEKK